MVVEPQPYFLQLGFKISTCQCQQLPLLHQNCCHDCLCLDCPCVLDSARCDQGMSGLIQLQGWPLSARLIPPGRCITMLQIVCREWLGHITWISKAEALYCPVIWRSLSRACLVGFVNSGSQAFGSCSCNAGDCGPSLVDVAAQNSNVVILVDDLAGVAFNRG